MTLVYRALNRDTGFQHRGKHKYCVGMLSLNEKCKKLMHVINALCAHTMSYSAQIVLYK